MELLIAFLLAFGAIAEEGAKEAKSTDELKEIMMKNEDLQKKYIIWEAEGDDF
jgi:Na+-transporting methylmalonyl-CoA/oxaloacetate decarboxylase gamma subunit